MASAYIHRGRPARDVGYNDPMTRARRLLLAVALVAIAGCATTVPEPPARQSQSPRTRCLSDPTETGTRPLFFLFCIETP